MIDQIPTIDKHPSSCPVCETAVTLGLLTAVCESSGSEKGKCYELLKPLENGSQKPIDALASVIVALSDSGVNETLDRMNLILMGATAKAKDELMRMGKMDKDGNPKD